MPSFQDSIFLFVLALLLFGPKRLPVLARELGKWVGEFRRASNEFKMQMEEELRLSEQADRQKQIAAIEAAAPIPPPLEQPEHPHLPAAEQTAGDTTTESTAEPFVSNEFGNERGNETISEPLLESSIDQAYEQASDPTRDQAARETIDGVSVLPIATSGDLRMMPPSTGLPTPRQAATRAADPLGGLLDAIPETSLQTGHIPESRNIPETEAPETAAHGL